MGVVTVCRHRRMNILGKLHNNLHLQKKSIRYHSTRSRQERHILNKAANAKCAAYYLDVRI